MGGESELGFRQFRRGGEGQVSIFALFTDKISWHVQIYLLMVGMYRTGMDRGQSHRDESLAGDPGNIYTLIGGY